MKREFVSLLVLLALYLSFTVVFGRFTTTDEIAFKAAGREWAQTGRFAAPELKGWGNFDPPVERIWFAQLPLYTFLFGLFVKVWGFAATQSVLFDALIKVALSIITYALCRAFAPANSRWWATVAGAMVLPFGVPGRPDSLAALFGAAAVLLLARRVTRAQLIAAGILLGCCGATSLVAAALLSIPSLALVFANRRATFIRSALLLGVVAMIVAAALLAPIPLANPDALRQFTSHATRQFQLPTKYALREAARYGSFHLLLVVSAIAVAVFTPLRTFAIRFAPALAAAALSFVLSPAKSYYLWFPGPILIAAMCSAAGEMRSRLRLIPAFLLFCAAIVLPVRSALIVAALPKDQRLSPNLAHIRRIVPRGSSVASAEYWSSIANDYRYQSLPNGSFYLTDVDYVLLTANGSGSPGEPPRLLPTQQADLERDFAVAYDNLNRRPSAIGPLPLSRSAWGFGVRIYRRKR